MEALTKSLVESSNIVVFTGAGISTGAGIPDYRGPQGVWKTRPEINLGEFMDDSTKRDQYWQFKAEDYAQVKRCEPTPSHLALVRLHELGKLNMVLTQNIDGLHRRAGLPEDKLVELHGRMDEVECTACGFRASADAYYQAVLDHGTQPTCPECDALLKPGVIMFGQGLRPEDMERAQQAMFDLDLVIAIGSTLAVQPAASFPIMAARMGVPYIIINQGETAHDGMPHVAQRLEGDVQEIFPQAVNDAGAMFG